MGSDAEALAFMKLREQGASNSIVIDVPGIQAQILKLENRFKKKVGKNYDWIERPEVISSRRIEILEGVNIDNDVQREIEFYNIAFENLGAAMERLKKRNIPIVRP
jgi:hypothetical protein